MLHVLYVKVIRCDIGELFMNQYRVQQVVWYLILSILNINLSNMVAINHKRVVCEIMHYLKKAMKMILPIYVRYFILDKHVNLWMIGNKLFFIITKDGIAVI